MEKVDVKVEETTKDPDSSTPEQRKIYRKRRYSSSSSSSSSSRSHSRENHSSRRRHRSNKKSRRCRSKCSYSRCRSKCSYSRCRSRSRSTTHYRRARYYGSRENPFKSRVIGVFGLSSSTNEAKLLEVFSSFGGIEHVKILYDTMSGNSRGFGFVNFTEIEAATRARTESNGMSLDGRRIRVDYSITKRPHTPTPGIYMGARDSNSSDRRRRSGQHHRSAHRHRSSRSSRSSSSGHRRSSRDHRRSSRSTHEHRRSRRNHSRSRRHYSNHDSSRYSRSHSR